MTAVSDQAREIELDETAEILLDDSKKRRALRVLLAYSENEVEADGFVSKYAALPLVTDKSIDQDTQECNLLKKRKFIERLYEGRLHKLGACDHPDASKYEKLFYDYWLVLSAAKKLGWG
jgi:hypothetical protein